MRILHISSAVDFGGGEKHIVDLCRGLAERGHEVYLALRPTNKWQSRASYISPERIFHVSIRNSFGVFSAKRIGDFAKENEIDIIHAHVARDYIPASIASIASKRAKFVLTRHVMFPLKPFNRFALKNLSRAIGVSPAVCRHLATLFPREKVVTVANGIGIVLFGILGKRRQWSRQEGSKYEAGGGAKHDNSLTAYELQAVRRGGFVNSSIGSFGAF